MCGKISEEVHLENATEQPFVVAHAVEYTTDGIRRIGCVLMHVDEKEVKSNNSSFKTSLDWLTLSYGKLLHSYG